MRGTLRTPAGRDRRDRERGTATAETAVVLPILVAFLLGLVWIVSVAVTQIRVVDAARETARAVARDESHEHAVALGEKVAPAASRISIDDAGDEVVVLVVATVDGPGGLFKFLPGIEVDAQAVAAKEAP